MAKDAPWKPGRIESPRQLEKVLTDPHPHAVNLVKHLDGDIMVLGAGGKMGLDLCITALRAVRAAGVKKKVYAVSRFSDSTARQRAENAGLEVIPCDLLDRDAVAGLPRAANVLYLAGRKFGTSGSEDLTWAMNVVVPANAAWHFRSSRIVAFSTGCVYPLVSPAQGGCTEEDPVSPVGEYAQSALGRERVFEYFSRTFASPVCLFRLNYSNDLRYGVLHDIGRKVLDRQPVNLKISHVNVIWQGDAVNQALMCLDYCSSPPWILNITGPGILPVREIAEKFAQLMNRDVKFEGAEGTAMYLSNAKKAHELFGPPRVDADTIIRWTAQWLLAGGESLDKPTHFEVNNGKY